MQFQRVITLHNKGLHNPKKSSEVITRSKKELVDQTLQIPPQISSFKQSSSSTSSRMKNKSRCKEYEFKSKFVLVEFKITIRGNEYRFKIKLEGP